MGKRELIIIATVLIISFTLSSCTAPIQDRNIYRGTNGLEIDFIKSIPDEVYESTSFPLGIGIKNEGTYSITKDNPAIVSLVTDELYLTFDLTLLEENKNINIEGKSEYNSDGEYLILTLPDIQVKEIRGMIQNPKAALYFSLCYPYITTFSENMCIDFDIYGLDQREKACESKDISFSGGQGAPVAVTKISPIMQTTTDGLKPKFVIDITNKGKGLPWNSEDNQCSSSEGYKNEDWNKIKISGTISNKELECNPNPVRLIDNKGSTICKINSAFPKGTNYLSSLNLELEYNYVESTSKDIKIKRYIYDENYFEDIDYCKGKYEGDPCHPQGLKVCDENLKCVEKCFYCANDRTPLIECNNIREGFSCSCGYDEAKTLLSDQYQKSACLHALCCLSDVGNLKIDYSSQLPSGSFSEEKKLISHTEFIEEENYNLFIRSKLSNNYCAALIYDSKNEFVYATAKPKCGETINFDLSSDSLRNKITAGKTYYIIGIEYLDNSDSPVILRKTDKIRIDIAANNQKLAEEILKIPVDDPYISGLGRDLCAAFIKRILRRAYGLDKLEELSEIGLDCLESERGLGSNDAWDIAVCFLNKKRGIYHVTRQGADKYTTIPEIKKILQPGDLIFVSQKEGWCKWSGYNHYRHQVEGGSVVNYCDWDNIENAFRSGGQGFSDFGFCTQESLFSGEPSTWPQTVIQQSPNWCNFDENGQTFEDFPIITHIGIYLGDDKVAYYNTDEPHISDGTLQDFVSSVHADRIRIVVRPNYPVH